MKKEDSKYFHAQLMGSLGNDFERLYMSINDDICAGYRIAGYAPP